MNKIQKHHVMLLKEIDEICTKHEIPYVLCGRTAKDACKNNAFMGEYVYASVLMHAKDFMKFRKIVSKMEGRAVESILDYPDFPDGRAMRYVDENSTFMYGHNAHNYHLHGYYITIQQARSSGLKKHAARMVALTDQLVTLTTMPEASSYGVMGKKKKLALTFVRLLCKIFGKASVVRGLIRFQNRYMSKNTKKMAYIRKGKADISLNTSMLLDTKTVSFEGEALRVPSEKDAFIKAVWGSSWNTSETEEAISSPHLLVTSETVSYKELSSEEIFTENRKGVQQMMNERSALSAKISAMRKDIEKYWDILFMTRERYHLYTTYKPVEDVLLTKLSEGDYEYLKTVMTEYLASLKTWADKGWPLQISPALDVLALELLRHNKEEAAFKKVSILLDSSKLKPITLEMDETARQKSLEYLEQLTAVDEGLENDGAA